VKRQLAVLGCLVVVSVLILSIASCGAGKPNPNAPVKLRISWFGAKVRNEATIKAIDAYTAKHPNVTFDPEFTGSNPEYIDKLTTQSAAKNMPDIIIMDNAWLAEFAGRGQLADLSTGIDVSKIDPKVLNDGKYNGKLYAVPNSVASTAYVYNKAAVDSLGVATKPANGWKWDDLYKFGAEAKAKLGASKYAFTDVSNNYTMYEAYQLSQGKGDAIKVDGTVNIDRDTFLTFQKKYAEFRKSGIVPPAAITVTNKDGDVTLDLLLNGNVLVKNAFSSTFGSYDSQKADTYALVTMPRGVQASDYVKVAAFWSINALSKAIEPSKKVIDFLVNDMEAAKALTFNRGLQVNSDVLNQIGPFLTKTDKASQALVNVIMPDFQTYTMKVQGWSPFYQTDFPNITQQVMFDKKTAEAVYDELIAKAKEYVKK
jgi:multiple sugar transport system substrate-binding protein